MSTVVPDRIEKQILLRAPLARVWQAITDPQQFGAWFGVTFHGPFKAGERVAATLTPTTVDPRIAELQKPHAGLTFDIFVDSIEPQRRFAFRWHPYGIDPSFDPANEQMTLVAFTLEQQTDGVLLTVTESGFDRVSLERRAEAFRMNEGGWAEQMTLIEKYLAKAS